MLERGKEGLRVRAADNDRNSLAEALDSFHIHSTYKTNLYSSHPLTETIKTTVGIITRQQLNPHCLLYNQPNLPTSSHLHT